MLSRSLNGLARNFATSATKVATVEGGSSVHESDHRHAVAKYQPELKISRLSNSLMVSSLDTNRPTSRLALVFRAGTRHEKEFNLGVAHRICAQVGLGSEKHSTFSTIINTSLMGGRLHYHLSRDLIVFQMDLTREHATDGIMLLGDIICRPSFRTWELDYSEQVLEAQCKAARKDPTKRVLDLVHKAAFRNQGLGNPITAPNHMVGKHSPDMLRAFHTERFLSGEGGVVAENVNHEGLLTFCTDFLPVVDGKGGLPTKSIFHSGEERRDIGGTTAHVVIAGEGPSARNQKELATYAVLSHLLGSGPVAPWSDFAGQGLIGQSVGKAAGAVRTIMSAYADTGLFGIYVAGEADGVAEQVRKAIAPLKTLASGPVSDSDIASAKAGAAAKAHISAESGNSLFDGLLRQTLLGEGEFASPPEFAEIIDSVTAADITTAAKKVTAHLAMSAVGNLHKTPYLDEIVKS